MSDSSLPSLIPFPGAVGALYDLGADAWAAINSATSDDCIVTNPFVSEDGRKQLAGVCATWRSHTYPGLIAHAAMIGIFAGGVPEILGKLRDEFASARDSEPLTDSQKFSCRLQFGAFADHAKVVGDGAGALVPEIAAFITVARIIAQCDRMGAYMMSGGPPLGDPLRDAWREEARRGSVRLSQNADALDAAAAALQAGWEGILAQLQALATGQATFATADHARAEIDAATPEWQALQRSAVAFSQHAAG